MFGGFAVAVGTELGVCTVGSNGGVFVGLGIAVGGSVAGTDGFSVGF